MRRESVALREQIGERAMAASGVIRLWQVVGWVTVLILGRLTVDLPSPISAGEGLGSLSLKIWVVLIALVVLLVSQLGWAAYRRQRKQESLDEAMDRLAPRPPASRPSTVVKPVVAPSAAPPVQPLSHRGAMGEGASPANPVAAPRSIWWRVTMTVLYLPCASVTWFVWKLIKGPYVVEPLHRQFPQFDEPIAFGLAALSTLLFFLLLVPFVSIWRLGRQ